MRVAHIGRFVAVGMIASVTGLHAQGNYQNYDDLTRELRSVASGSNAVTLQSIATTVGGRDVWLVQIGQGSDDALANRPGLLIVGNLEGDHLLGSALAMSTIRHLATSNDSAVARLRREQVVYVVPRLNPDGAEAFFAATKWDRRVNSRPFDDDNDGRVDEDPPEDLNGDGVITLMRVATPNGPFLVDSVERRALRRAEPANGDVGAYRLFTEGRDTDGDGFINEDGPGGVDLNRNFQHAYPYWQRDAGSNMVSEAESRGLIDFMVAHGNVGAVLTYGHSDNLVNPLDARGALASASVPELPRLAASVFDSIFDRGVFQAGGGGGGFGFGGGGGGLNLRGAQVGRDNDPNSGRRPSTTVHEQDLRYFETVAKAYKDLTGIASVAVNRVAEGAFFQWGYFQFGVPSFSTAGWGLPSASGDSTAGAGAGAGAAAGGRGRAAGGAARGADARILAATDAAGINAFVDWTPFNHPDLGPVEIGGYRPYALVNPPVSQLADLGAAHAAFAVRLASMLPRVRISQTSVTAHGGGVFTVRAEIENTGFFPTSLQHGVVSQAVQPTTVQIQVPPESILTGADKSSTVNKLDGSGVREQFTWVIRGQTGTNVEIRVRSQKGGSDTATVTLR